MVFYIMDKHTTSVLVIIIIVMLNVEVLPTFVVKCPDSAQWNLRAQGFCNASSPSYICLLDDNNDRIIETCERQPDFQTPGYRFVIRGGYDAEQCNSNRYQPFTFWTDGNSDCVFSKSRCEDEGQIYSNYGSTISDVSCRCDHTKGYAFVTTPLNPSACIPSEEDCSCYLKRCENTMGLAADYTCRGDSKAKIKVHPHKEKRLLANVNKESTTLTEQHQSKVEALMLPTGRSALIMIVTKALVGCVIFSVFSVVLIIFLPI